jgi:hypothetical protein
MIALEEKKSRMPKVVRIEAVRHLSGCKLGLRFSDGHLSTVDFGPFLKASPHPSIRAYLDLKRFKGFTLEDGVLHWHDFDLVFPMAELYEGKIS